MNSLRGFTNHKGIVNSPDAIHPTTYREWYTDHVEPATRERVRDLPREDVDDTQAPYYAARFAYGHYETPRAIREKVRVAYVSADATQGFVRDYLPDRDIYAIVAAEPDKGSPTNGDAPELLDILYSSYPSLGGGSE